MSPGQCRSVVRAGPSTEGLLVPSQALVGVGERVGGNQSRSICLPLSPLVPLSFLSALSKKSKEKCPHVRINNKKRLQLAHKDYSKVGEEESKYSLGHIT